MTDEGSRLIRSLSHVAHEPETRPPCAVAIFALLASAASLIFNSASEMILSNVFLHLDVISERMIAHTLDTYPGMQSPFLLVTDIKYGAFVIRGAA